MSADKIRIERTEQRTFVEHFRCPVFDCPGEMKCQGVTEIKSPQKFVHYCDTCGVACSHVNKYPRMITEPVDKLTPELREEIIEQLKELKAIFGPPAKQVLRESEELASRRLEEAELDLIETHWKPDHEGVYRFNDGSAIYPTANSRAWTAHWSDRTDLMGDEDGNEVRSYFKRPGEAIKALMRGNEGPLAAEETTEVICTLCGNILNGGNWTPECCDKKNKHSYTRASKVNPNGDPIIALLQNFVGSTVSVAQVPVDTLRDLLKRVTNDAEQLRAYQKDERR